MGEDVKRTILCVDDEPDVVSALFDTFMDSYEVKTATSGAEALKIFDEENISLVISDQRMPEMEGTELLSKINEIKPICKKILLTGYADINAAIDAINLGAVDKYFSKPWEDDELLEAVKGLLEEFSMDEFFEKALEDKKGMEENLVKLQKDSGLYTRFLDNYMAGVCLLGEDESIQYVNKRGLSLLKCKDINEVTGKAYKEIFSITESDKNKLVEKNMKKDPSPVSLSIKLCDGSTGSLQISAAFASEEGGIKMSGMVFNK